MKKFCKWNNKNHPCRVWLQLAQVLQRRWTCKIMTIQQQTYVMAIGYITLWISWAKKKISLRFQRRILFKLTNQKQELPVVAMFVSESGLYEQIVYRTFNKWFLPSFGSFGQAVSKEIFYKLTNQKQELPMVAMFVNGSGQNEQSI